MSNQPPNPQELADQINQLVEQLTTSRGDAVSDARSLQIAGQALLGREEQRLRRKLGDDHPRLQQLRQRREALLGSAQRLEVERQIAAVQPPEVDDAQALVQGRVTDENEQGIQGLQVSLVDENGKPISRQPVTSDSSGFYAQVLDPALVKGGRTASLVVDTKTGRELYRSAKPFQIEEGSRVTIDVNLNLLKLSQSGGSDTPPADQVQPWVIGGAVSDAKGNPLTGLTVQVTSGEIKKRDPLGAASTNRRGAYQIRISPDLTIDGLQPGIHLTVHVLDQSGLQVYTSSEEILFKPGAAVTHDIQLNLPAKRTQVKDK